MKFIDFFIFLFVLSRLTLLINSKLQVSLEKTKETKKLRGKNLYHSIIINDSKVIYESFESGVHLIEMDERMSILKLNVFLINNGTNCSNSLLNSIAAFENSFFLMFSVDNWELCLDDQLIRELNVSSLSYLKSGKRGLGHAFVYFSNGQNFVLNISHESHFIGNFRADIHDYEQKKLESLKDKESQSHMKIPFNNSSFSFESKHFLPQFEKNLSANDSSKEHIRKVDDGLEYFSKGNFSFINSEVHSNESEEKTYNNSEKESTSNQKIELVSVGLNYSSNDFSSIKINGRLVHASHSCGLHAVAYDPCINETNAQREKKKAQKMKILELYEKIMENEDSFSEITEIDCHDSLKTLNLIGSLKKKGELKLKCPKNCIDIFEPTDENGKNSNYLKNIGFEEEICYKALKSNMISNERGGILIVKFPDINIEITENFPFFQKEADISFILDDYRLKADYFQEHREYENNFSKIISKSLDKASKINEIDNDEMKDFQQKFDFEENPFTLLPKLIRFSSPEKQVLANELDRLREEGKFDEFKKNIANLQIFYGNDIFNAFDVENENQDDNMVLFTRSFRICKQTNPEGYSRELQKLKQTFKTIPNSYKILMTSLGSYFSSSFDSDILKYLENFGASNIVFQEFLNFENNYYDFPLIFIHGFSKEIELELSRLLYMSNFTNKLSFNFSFNSTNECLSKQNGQENFSSPCFAWNCRFFSVLYNETINTFKENQTIAFSFLKKMSFLLSNPGILTKLEQLKSFPFEFIDFLLNPSINNSFKNEAVCLLELKSNSQKGFANIKYRGLTHNISDEKQNNSLLIAVIDDTCEKNLIQTKTFSTDTNDIIEMSLFLQKIDENYIIAFAQLGFFNWTHILNTSLPIILENYGFFDLESLYKILESENNVFLGKRMRKFKGISQISMNSEAYISKDLCNDEFFKACTRDFLYLKVQDTTMVILNDKLIANDYKKGIYFLILSCFHGTYIKIYDQTFDLWSNGQEINDLNKKITEFSKKFYESAPLFILTSIGNYEYYYQENDDHWNKFFSLLEMLGASFLKNYLKEDNFIEINHKMVDFGHPFIIVGSPKFNKMTAFESFFDKTQEITEISSFKQAELLINLEKGLKCSKMSTNITNSNEINEEDDVFKDFSFKSQEDKDIIFPTPYNNTTNPCIQLVNLTKPAASKTRYLDKKTSNVTYSLYIRGLISSKIIDETINFKVNNLTLCDSPLEKIERDHFELNKLPNNLRKNYQLLKLYIYRCKTKEPIPIRGDYFVTLEAKKYQIQLPLKCKINQIDDFNFEMKVFI